MPNTPVRAAAEGMPSINRRKALVITATGLAAALVGIATRTRAAPAVPAVSSRLRELDKAFTVAWGKVKAFEPSSNAAERAAFDARPPRPVDEEWPADLHARFREVPIGRVNDMSIPAIAETQAIGERNEAKRAAYAEACEAAFAVHRKIDARYSRLLDRADQIARRANRVPARTLADVIVKVRIHSLNQFDDAEFLDVLLRDIARLDRASRKVVQS